MEGLIGDVSPSGLIFAAVAGLVGYIIGSQLKSAIKIALIVLALAALLGLITPAMLSQIAEWISALKPMLSGLVTQQAKSELSLSFTCFLFGLIVGLWRG